MADTQEPATTAAMKAPAKKTAKKAPAKKSTSKRSTTKKSAAKKAAAKKAPAKRTSTKAAAKSVDTKTTKDSATSMTAAGKDVVIKATAAARKPVEAGRAVAGRTGERVADLSRAVLAPSSKYLTSAQNRAKDLVADPTALRSLAERALHSQSGRAGPLGHVVDEFKTLGRLVAAYSRGDYRDIPLDSLVMVTAGLVYVVLPVDLIPDDAPIAGYADDAVAVGFVIQQVHRELAAFRDWEATRPARS